MSADQIKRADLGGADVSALSNREKSFIALAMGTHASKNDQVTQEQIITLLENQGIRFDIHDSELVAHFAGFTALTPWLEHADDFTPQVARELANVFARRGIAEQYEAIQKYLEPSDSELDPLYYLIQGFTPLRMTMGDGTSLHSGNYVAIAQRIKEQGYEVKEHHRRALFERSVEKASAANSIMSLFPELTPVSDDEYFSVKCEEQVQIELL